MPRKRTKQEELVEGAPEARRPAPGRLKVFLGACPGVGKTYSMLSDARVKKGEGVDVVVGLAETHGRKETEKLLEGQELLPRNSVAHGSVTLTEFDLDGALKRKPGLLLVDELAHTNAPGSRHAKRWQDVLELLERGVDVYSTLNIQHLESLNDIVAQITGVQVRETVPDSILERANVELVDLPPGELLDRLKEGKVYLPEVAARAAENFFKLSNLTALRELSLRVTAEGVGAVLEAQRLTQAPEKIWPTAERILVCVGPGPYSARLVRAARRMATALHAEWYALFVDAPSRPLTKEQRDSAVENLRMAERLGAETLSLGARDVVEGVLEFARQRNITKIVVGKQPRPRWLDVFKTSLVDQLIRRSGDVDIYVISGEGAPAAPGPARAVSEGSPGVPPSEYGIALAAVAAATGLCSLLYPHFQPTNLVMVYLLTTLVVASRGYRGPAVLTSLLGVLCFDFFFIPPRFAFAVSDTEYILTFAVMFVVAVVISALTVRIREQAQTAQLGEMRTATMHALSRELASTRGVDAILRIAVQHVAEVFDSDVIALLPSKLGPLEPRAWSGETRELDEKERSVAQWVFDLGQSAGLGTQTLPVVEALYAPLLGGEGPVGALRVQPRVRERLLVPDQMLLLESFAHQIALALEVDRLAEQSRQALINAETERLRSSLLSSVSHDLRTPLAGIIGSATSLLQTGAYLGAEKGRELLLNIQEEAERLSRLVHNLIETTRLESGSARLKKEPHSIEDVIGASLERMAKGLAGRQVRTEVPEDLPLVPLDALLMEQVFSNLLDNAVRYTPPGTTLEISARLHGESLLLEVADRGPGVPPEDLERVFEKFYRAAPGTGAGLGLAICKAVVEAHGGRIWAENRPDGGAAFRFTLPLKDKDGA